MSSFVKIKKENSIEIPGVKSSIRNGQVCSSGSDSFDFVIGGGIELNSLFLIGEDKYGRYADILTKLYLADAFHHNHQIYFANLDDDPRKIMKDIPMPSDNITREEKSSETSDDSLRIAFRYQALPKLDSVQRATQTQMNYDLTKKYEADKIESCQNIKYLTFNDYQEKKKSAFDIVIEDLQKITSTTKDNLIRVCISSLGSPLWYTENFSNDLLKFLIQLKSIARYNNLVCFLTMPLHLMNIVDDQLIFKIRKIIDVNVNLESFDNVDKQTNAVFKQYHGLLHVKKLQTLTALQSHKPEAFDLAFKLKLHRFVIEKLHLPPELQESETSTETSMSCSSGGGNKSLDF